MTKPRLRTFTHSSSVSFGRPDLVHPRLQLVSRAVKDGDGVAFYNFLRIYILGSNGRDHLAELLSTATKSDIDPPTSSGSIETDEIDQALENALSTSQSTETTQIAEQSERELGFGPTKRILGGYLIERQKKSLDNPTLNRLARYLLKNRLQILELETLEEAEASIQTNRYGLPVDTCDAPIEIEMQAILQAIENENVVLEEGNFAFVPNIHGASALIGKIDRGHMNLVLVPPDVMRGIIAFEGQWFETLKTLIRSAYQSPTPGQGSQQEQQEPGGDASGNSSENELELIPDSANGSPECESSSNDQSDGRLPHFATIHD